MSQVSLFTTSLTTIEVDTLTEPIDLHIFGDVHYGCDHHSAEKWRKFRTNCLKSKNPYYIGMGDFIDLGSESERKCLNGGILHESTQSTLTRLYEQQCDGLLEDIGFMRGRLLGLIEGNHYAEFRDQTTSTQRMCRDMKCDYLGISSFIKLRIVYHGTRTSIDIWAHHGKAGAQFVSTSLKKVEDMARTAEADVYIMGHDHQRGAVPLSRLKLNRRMQVVDHTAYAVRSGSFLRGYVAGEESYVARAGLKPASLGGVTLHLQPQRVCEGKEKSRKFTIEMSATV